MARWPSNDQYVNIDLNVSNIYLYGDWPYLYFHFDCDFNYYCPSGWATMNYDGVDFNTTVSGYSTETKTDNVSFYLSAGQESARYGANFYNPDLGNSRQRTVDVQAWISGGLYTGGGWTTVDSPTVGDPSSLQLSISSVTQSSCVVSHSFTNNRNYWFVRLWDRNTRTYYTLNNNAGNGTTTITGLNPNQTYAFELWACGRDGNEYAGAHPAQSITTLGKSSVGNTPTYTIGSNFILNISGYSDSFTHTLTFTIGNYSFSRTNVRRGNNTIVPSATENTAIYAQMSTVLSKGMSITLTTYVNSISIGSNSGSGVVNINTASCTPTVYGYVYKDVNSTSIALTGNNQYVLQNVSKLQVSNINADAKNSASIAKFRLDVSGATYENTSTTIATSTITSNTQMSVKAIDSRGLQGTLNKGFALFVPYTAPVVSNFSVTRANGIEMKTTLTISGTYSPVNINNVNKNNIETIKYRFKATTIQTWGELKTLPFIGDAATFSYTNVIGDFDVNSSYNFELQVKDKIQTITSSTILVVGKPTLSVRKNGIGINKMPATGVALDIEGNVNTSGKVASQDTISSAAGFYKGTNYLQPMSKANGYWGFSEITDYIRTPLNGILPYQSGGAGASYVGTSSWPFTYIYGNNFYKGGVAMPNNNEVPLISSGNGWSVYRFPSGLMVQTLTYAATCNISNSFGGVYFGYVSSPPNYPIAFVGSIYDSQVSVVDNDVMAGCIYNRSTVNFSGNNTFYAYCGIAKSKTVNFSLLTIGRWK